MRALRIRDVLQRVGLSRSTVYAYVHAGLFPKPLRLGARAVGWMESDIDAWLQAKLAPDGAPLSQRSE